MDPSKERKLILELVSELRKEGSICLLESVAVFSKRIRPLLADMKLLEFLEDHPDIFRISHISNNSNNDNDGDHDRDRLHTQNIEPLSTQRKIKVHLTSSFNEILLSNYSFDATMSTPSDYVSNNTDCQDIVTTESAQFTCDKCCTNMSFQSRNALFKHIRNIHTNSSSKLNLNVENNIDKKIETKCINDLLLKVKTYFRENKSVAVVARTQSSSTPSIPLSWLMVDRKLKSGIRLYLRSLPMSVLPADRRFEYETPSWWESAAVQLLLALKSSSDFTINNYEFDDVVTLSPYGTSNCRFFSPKNVMISCICETQTETPLPRSLPHGALDRKTPRDCDASQCLKSSCTSGDSNGGELCEEEDKCEDDILFQYNRGLDILYRSSTLLFVNKPEKVRMESVISFCNKNYDTLKLPCKPQESCDSLRLHQKSENQSLSTSVESSNCSLLPVSSLSYTVSSVSRLDQPTSGVVAIPLSLACERILTQKFKHREVDKYYLCIVTGDIRTLSSARRVVISGDEMFVGEVNVRLRHVQSEMKTFAHPAGKNSITKYCCVYVFSNSCMEESDVHHVNQSSQSQSHSLLVCKPVTGRTHQIRAHMAHLGIPLLGDLKYDRLQLKKKTHLTSQRLYAQFPRLMLHSYQIRLHFSSEEQEVAYEGKLAPSDSSHSTTTSSSSSVGSDLAVTAPIPDDFMRACVQLGMMDAQKVDETKAGRSVSYDCSNHLSHLVSLGVNFLSSSND